MDLRTLRYFVAVAELNSVSQAALKIHVAQPALSRQIRRLERELGVDLLVRNRRGVTLTDAGTVLLSRAKLMLELQQTLRDEVMQSSGTPAGRLSIGMPAALGGLLLPRTLRELIRRYPRVEPYVMEGLSGQLTEALASAKIDVAVMNNAPASEHVDVEPFLISRMFLVMPPTYKFPGKSARRATLAEIARLPLLLANSSNTLRQTIDAAFSNAGLQLRPIVEVDSLSLLKSLVASGIGCTLLNYYAVAEEVKRGMLKAMPIDGGGIPWRLDLVIARQRVHSLAVGAFVKLLTIEAKRVLSQGELRGSLAFHPERQSR
jgi:LysR family nitrogen assimilation transcriptional regulator